MSKFIEIHALQWFPLSCINRDDAGMPKRMMLAGELRDRWSSQSQKYALRKAFSKYLDAENLCIKTRRLALMTVDELSARGRSEQEAAARTTAIMFALGFNMNTTEEAKKEAEEQGEVAVEEDVQDTNTFGKVLTGRTQVIIPIPQAGPGLLADAVEKHWDVLADVVDLAKIKSGKVKDAKVPAAVVKTVLADAKKAIDSDRLVDVAMFGRMLTEIPSETVEAASSVAHAFTVHASEYTSEFWSAVDDDAASQGHGGSANMGIQGLNTGCFYRYAAVDLDTLREGPLADDEALVQEAVAAFLKAFATLRPRAMIHGTAPFVDPSFVGVSVSNTPRSLADAFVRPVLDGDAGYLSDAAVRLMATWEATDNAYGVKRESFILSAHPDVEVGEIVSTMDSATEYSTLADLVRAATEAAFRE